MARHKQAQAIGIPAVRQARDDLATKHFASGRRDSQLLIVLINGFSLPASEEKP